ncbi:GerAB/ArcD/ProY family transporter [Brevibacillus nitrificans]|uniref:GerAB/ArcD/ProY family transporter n=1 Tax=Brevibacillus nitrificans TaxID=651560 RepID=UPI00261860C7|nr:endospore germination permease [Brevibacillus nitrificans]MED1795587.1 endospore germination permease [Brevibacillus nitrificans]
MTNARSFLSRAQFFFLVAQTQIGIGIIALSHDVHKYARGDAWLSVLGAGVVSQGMIFLYWLLCSKLPNQTLFQMIASMWGKIPSLIVKLYYVGYFVYVAATIVNAFAGIVTKWLLPLTPEWVIFFIALAAGMYLAIGPLVVLARLYGVAMFNLGLIVFLLLLGLDDTDIRYILPIGESGANGVIRGMYEALFSFNGYEILLFAFPYISREVKKKEILLTASAANALTTLVYVFVVAVCTTYFSPAEIDLIKEPVLYLLSSYSIVLMERVDLVFLAVWMVTVTTSYGTYLYLAGSGFSALFHKSDKSSIPLLFLLVAICFAFAFLPKGIQDQIDSFSPWFDLVGLIVVPVLALLTAYVTRAGRRGLS